MFASRRVVKTTWTTVLQQNLSANVCKYSSAIQEVTLQVKGQTINYVKTGNGSHSVLCFPGALGTIWSDFEPQIKNLNKEEFTVVAWDPPGYGRSRPPNRNFSTKFYENDATMAHDFMTEMGIKKYSLLGWSDGGISSLILSARYPQAVNKLVVWGANSYVISQEVQSYESVPFWTKFAKQLHLYVSEIRDISKWSDRMKAPLIKLYGTAGLQDMWNGWCDALGEIFKQGGDICKNDLPLIKCPTLIIHGDKDPLVASEHPDYLLKHIKGSQMHRFPEGKHNLHLKYAKEFNALITKFLLTNETSKL